MAGSRATAATTAPTWARSAPSGSVAPIRPGLVALRSPGRYYGGEVQAVVRTLKDITDRKRTEETLLHNAFHDALTGLPNRALFMDHVKMAIQRSRRSGDRLFAALFLDLDRFKIINDTLGHESGDLLLREVAQRITEHLRTGDIVARLGGDEFTILLEDLATTDDALDVARRVQEAVTQPFNIGGHEVFTTASIGIALSNTGYERAEDDHQHEDEEAAERPFHGASRSGVVRQNVFKYSTTARLSSSSMSGTISGISRLPGNL